jgi:hypothetical protein
MLDQNIVADILRGLLTECGLKAEALRQDLEEQRQLAEAYEFVVEFLYDALERYPD